MNVTLVHDWLTGMRGGEKCLDALCRRYPWAELLTLLHRRGSTSAAIERMRIRASWLNHLPGVTRHYRWLLPLMPQAIESLRVAPDTDLVLSLSHAVAKGVIAPRGVPHVCYCFTPMRYAWQLRDEYFGPSEQRRSLLGRTRDALLDRVRDWDLEASQRVTHFIAISRTIADRISACYGRSSTIIYPPTDVEFYTPDPLARSREDFYLCVSALVPYKRLELAVRACRATGRRLIVIGAGTELLRLQQVAAEERGSGQVDFLGWQSDEVIRDHLRRCRALLFPGNEDFGIVPVEAQACGAPVIAFNRGGVTETVLEATATQHGTGVFFEAPTVDALVGAIEWFEAHTEQCDPQLAREQAERFSLARYETELFNYLERVVDPALPEPVYETPPKRVRQAA